MKRCVHCGHYATRTYTRKNGQIVDICSAEQCLRDEWSLDDENPEYDDPIVIEPGAPS